MPRLIIYDRKDPPRDRWIPGDRYVRPIVRRIVRGAPRPGGLDKVRTNLCLGLDKLGASYVVNPPFNKIRDTDLVTVLGRGRTCLEGYRRANHIMAGIGLMTHPAEWPNLFNEYPVVCYLQHSEWVRNIYAAYFGESRVKTWPVGIDTDTWVPSPDDKKTVDFLIYDKIMWERSRNEAELLNPILEVFRRRQITWEVIRYGEYRPDTYRASLRRCRAMLFLCEHESQGIAYQEAMSAGVPILAWNQGWWLDPNRIKWNAKHTPATSVPFFDQRCGIWFRDILEFGDKLDTFLTNLKSGVFDPRSYVTEVLSIPLCAARFIELAKVSSR